MTHAAAEREGRTEAGESTHLSQSWAEQRVHDGGQLLHGAGRRRRRQGAEREGYGREQHRYPGGHGRAGRHREEASGGQGLRRKTGEASKRCGDADWHGQPGMDAQARGEQPGRGRQPEADAVLAEPAVHPDGERQGRGPKRTLLCSSTPWSRSRWRRASSTW